MSIIYTVAPIHAPNGETLKYMNFFSTIVNITVTGRMTELQTGMYVSMCHDYLRCHNPKLFYSRNFNIVNINASFSPLLLFKAEVKYYNNKCFVEEKYSCNCFNVNVNNELPVRLLHILYYYTIMLEAFG